MNRERLDVAGYPRSRSLAATDTSQAEFLERDFA